MFSHDVTRNEEIAVTDLAFTFMSSGGSTLDLSSKRHYIITPAFWAGKIFQSNYLSSHARPFFQ